MIFFIVIVYEGKLQILTTELQCYEPDIQIEFHGDLGETGLLNLNIDSSQLNIDEKSNSKQIVNF